MPLLIKKYIPLDDYEEVNHEIFELMLNNIVNSLEIADKGYIHFLFECMLHYAVTEDHYERLVEWFEADQVIVKPPR